MNAPTKALQQKLYKRVAERNHFPIPEEVCLSCMAEVNLWQGFWKEYGL